MSVTITVSSVLLRLSVIPVTQYLHWSRHLLPVLDVTPTNIEWEWFAFRKSPGAVDDKSRVWKSNVESRMMDCTNRCSYDRIFVTPLGHPAVRKISNESGLLSRRPDRKFKRWEASQLWSCHPVFIQKCNISFGITLFYLNFWKWPQKQLVLSLIMSRYMVALLVNCCVMYYFVYLALPLLAPRDETMLIYKRMYRERIHSWTRKLFMFLHFDKSGGRILTFNTPSNGQKYRSINFELCSDVQEVVGRVRF